MQHAANTGAMPFAGGCSISGVAPAAGLLWAWRFVSAGCGIGGIAPTGGTP